MKCVIDCGREASTFNLCDKCYRSLLKLGRQPIGPAVDLVKAVAKLVRRVERKNAAKIDLLWGWASRRRAALISLDIEGEVTVSEEKELRFLQRVTRERVQPFEDRVLKNIKKLEKRVAKREREGKRLHKLTQKLVGGAA